ncbi:MAG TPA: hypothetical protein VH231_21700 [Solirubrobacteraceae bacterium]|jgi:hypothetical protein|nr:hypothetical protein [Solirubrobacteraceae bacterium]
MRKFSLVVAAVVALSLAMAPGVEAASADLINGVQQQITNAGGSLPTSPAGQQTFINNLVSAGVLPADQAAAAQQVLQAIAAADPTADAATVAELLGSGINPTAITGLINLTPPSSFDSFLQGFSVPSGQTPTGTSLAPLTSQLRTLAATGGIDPNAASLLNGLADQIDAAGSGALSSSLLDQLRGALAAVGAITTQGGDALKKLLGSLVPVTPASTGSSTAAGPAPAGAPAPVALPVVTPFNLVLKVAKIKLASNRKSASVTLRSSAPAAAVPVGFATTLGRKAAAKPVLFNLASGKNVTKKVTLTSSATKTLKKKGGTLKVTPAFNVPGLSSVPGITLAETAKSLKVRKPHAKRTKHKARKK